MVLRLTLAAGCAARALAAAVPARAAPLMAGFDANTLDMQAGGDVETILNFTVTFGVGSTSLPHIDAHAGYPWLPYTDILPLARAFAGLHPASGAVTHGAGVDLGQRAYGATWRTVSDATSPTTQSSSLQAIIVNRSDTGGGNNVNGFIQRPGTEVSNGGADPLIAGTDTGTPGLYGDQLRSRVITAMLAPDHPRPRAGRPDAPRRRPARPRRRAAPPRPEHAVFTCVHPARSGLLVQSIVTPSDDPICTRSAPSYRASAAVRARSSATSRAAPPSRRSVANSARRLASSLIVPSR